MIKYLIKVHVVQPIFFFLFLLTGLKNQLNENHTFHRIPTNTRWIMMYTFVYPIVDLAFIVR